MEKDTFSDFNQVGSKKESFRNISILVAEDNVINQIVLRKFLNGWGVGKIVFASDGQKAIDEFQKGEFNLVLLDVQMHVLDGFEVARLNREDEDSTKRQTPILVFSATSHQEIIDEMEAFAIDEFIEKPFTPEGLYGKITKYLHSIDRI